MPLGSTKSVSPGVAWWFCVGVGKRRATCAFVGEGCDLASLCEKSAVCVRADVRGVVKSWQAQEIGCGCKLGTDVSPSAVAGCCEGCVYGLVRREAPWEVGSSVV